jgi:hypothetical protein
MEKESTQKENSRIVLAVVLIAVGVLWMLKRMGIYFEFPVIHLNHLFIPVRQIFSGWGDFIFSWQVVLILVGLVLMAGKRSVGIVLIIVGGIFLLPKIIFFPPLNITYILPALLIGAGVVIIARYV